MYSIAHIIYGVPLSEKISQKINDYENSESDLWFEDKNGMCGFRIFYHGSADQLMGFCGVELDTFAEFKPFIDVSKLTTKPTPEQVSEANRQLEALCEELRGLCDPVGVYLVWSTS